MHWNVNLSSTIHLIPLLTEEMKFEATDFVDQDRSPPIQTAHHLLLADYGFLCIINIVLCELMWDVFVVACESSNVSSVKGKNVWQWNTVSYRISRILTFNACWKDALKM